MWQSRRYRSANARFAPPNTAAIYPVGCHKTRCPPHRSAQRSRPMRPAPPTAQPLRRNISPWLFAKGSGLNPAVGPAGASDRSKAVFLRTEVPNHPSNAGQQKHEADYTPNHRSARRTIADQFFVWPVLGVRNILARPVCAGCPCGPPEERGHLSLLGWIAKRARGDCVCVAPVPVNVSIVGCQLLKCRSTVSVNCDGIRAGIVRVPASEFGQSPLKSCSRFGRQRLIIRGPLLFRPPIQNNL